jgi:hypothetical protein
MAGRMETTGLATGWRRLGIRYLVYFVLRTYVVVLCIVSVVLVLGAPHKPCDWVGY